MLIPQLSLVFVFNSAGNQLSNIGKPLGGIQSTDDNVCMGNLQQGFVPMSIRNQLAIFCLYHKLEG